MKSTIKMIGSTSPVVAIVAGLSILSAALTGCGSASRPESLEESTPLNSLETIVGEEGRMVGHYDDGVWVAPPVGIDDPSGEGSTEPTRGENNDPVDFARAQIGDRYVYGATGPNQWDCSGLTQAAYKVVRVNIPRTAAAQGTTGSLVSRSSLRRGDLVFFDCAVSDPKKKKTVTHVGIMLDNRYMIDANSAAGMVAKDDLNVKYWSDRFLHGRRVR